MSLLLSSLLVLLMLAPAVWIEWRWPSRLGRGAGLLLWLLGAMAGYATLYLERLVLRTTGLDFDVKVAGAGGALLAAFLLSGPLEEAAKVAIVWPLYRGRRLRTAFDGVRLASFVALGFAAAESVLQLQAFPSILGLTALRAVLSGLAHVFFAAAWGYALGAGAPQGRWFSWVWLGALLLHALYDHIVWGRGPGYLAAVAPMLGFMALGAYVVARSKPTTLPGPRTQHDPEALLRMQRALLSHEHGIAVSWVIAGVFVTLGLLLTLAVLSVVVGHRIGIDFTLADEADVRSAAPLALLGTGLLLAFPLSGYLISRASAAAGVLEAALSALIALSALVVLLALTAPVAVLFALAVTPIAIGLTCGGAWVGLDR